MGHSDPTNKEINPSTVLDCGAGAGVYLDLIRNQIGSDVVVDAVEVWMPYIQQFGLDKRYNSLYNIDLREVYNFNYDLVILGDVLEHMTEDDALKVWDLVASQAKYAIISIPIIHYHQDAINGNPYEVHVEEDWNTEKVLQKFKNIVEYQEFPQTGVFVAKFYDKEQ
jgi:hypothetical protein